MTTDKTNETTGTQDAPRDLPAGLVDAARADAVPRKLLDIRILMFEALVCSMALMGFVALIGPLAQALRLQPWHMGLAVSAAGIAWMALTRWWGIWAERFGHRHVILAGLAGFAVSYLVMVVVIDLALRFAAVPLLAFAGMLVARMSAGAFYAAVPPMAALLVADHAERALRPTWLAALGAATVLGLVSGPAFAGIIGAHSLTLPLYLLAILPFVALAILWRYLPRDRPVGDGDHALPHWSDPRIRYPMQVTFLSHFCVAAAQILVGFVALDRLALDLPAAAFVAGLAMACIGLALMAAQLLLQRVQLAPERLVQWGALIGLAGFGLVLFVETPVMLWASYALAAFGLGWVFPAAAAMAAQAVAPHEQAAAAASVSAAQGLGYVAGPLVGTLAYHWAVGLPFMVCVAMLAVITMLRPPQDSASTA